MHARLRELFDAAVGLSPVQRKRFAKEACGDDAVLHAELQSLLVCDEEDGDPLARSIAANTLEHFSQAPYWLGRELGNYRILRELGHGGMGSVYLAERADREYESQVAIKLIRGLPGTEALAHLRRERQLLASLNHPNIARLLDGGTSVEGQPYLVMEYIEGLTLAEWAQQRAPALDARLRLFQALCRGVHHAHQNLIVHRDIKPGNVMVREDGAPVLLDFGVATLAAGDDGVAQAPQAQAVTREYASPEQIAGQAVTTVSDVFGLGLILHELLCGAAFRTAGTGSKAASRASRIARQSAFEWIRDEASRIEGDLDRVVARALAEDPAHRYQSASALADEIDAYRAGLPLAAGPDRATYRAMKFARRHRAGVIAGVLAIACLAGAAAWLTAERSRALHAERAARLEAHSSQQVTQFLLHLFKGADPETARGRDISARELLDSGRVALQTGLADQPDVKARLLEALGEIYTSIGLPQQSTALLAQAVALLRAPGADPLALALALHEACRASSKTSQYAQALAACKEALALRETHLAPGDVDVGHTLDALGVVEQSRGDLAGAGRDYRRALAIFTTAGPAYRDEMASTHHNLGWLALHSGDYVQALNEYRRALEAKRALFGDAHPRTLNSFSGVARAEQALGNLDAAQRDFERILALRIRVNGADSVPTAQAHNALASAMHDVGDYADAGTHYRTALALEEKLEPADSLDAAITKNNLATLEEDRGDPRRALALFEQSLAIRAKKFEAPNPALSVAQHNLARCQLALGDTAAARPLLDAALNARRRLPESDADRFDSELLDAQWQLTAGHVDAAADALQRLHPPDGAGNYRRRARYAGELASVAAARRDWARAREAQHRVIAELEHALGAGHPLLAQAQARAAQYAHVLGEDERARALLRDALPRLREVMVANAADLVEAERLAQTLSSGRGVSGN